MNDSGVNSAAPHDPSMIVRNDRALFDVEGRDRASWLHNLTTNQVKTLQLGEGNYAFVLNVQGRILFDINLLVRAESIWIDLDRRFVETAQKHFSKYSITEQVTLVDRTAEFSRVGLIGSRCGSLLGSLGVGNATAMASLAQAVIRWREAEIGLIRHDFCGPMGFELFVPSTLGGDFVKFLREGGLGEPLREVSTDAIETLRIEHGIPWPGREITDEYLPAETRQLERAVSYQKGCYLGQEIVERMRSRQVLARQLVGLRLETSEPPACPTPILLPAGDLVGRLTSAYRSDRIGAAIGLGYVKTAHAAPGTRLKIAGSKIGCEAVVQSVPFQREGLGS